MQIMNFYGLMRAQINHAQSKGGLSKDVLKDTSGRLGWESTE